MQFIILPIALRMPLNGNVHAVLAVIFMLLKKVPGEAGITIGAVLFLTVSTTEDKMCATVPS
jgi:hypothetical protein